MLLIKCISLCIYAIKDFYKKKYMIKDVVNSDKIRIRRKTQRYLFTQFALNLAYLLKVRTTLQLTIKKLFTKRYKSYKKFVFNKYYENTIISTIFIKSLFVAKSVNDFTLKLFEWCFQTLESTPKAFNL